MSRFSAILFAGLVTAAYGQAEQSAAPGRDGVPVVLPRAVQYDLTSRINGRGYRVLVGMPPGYDKEKAYPVLYVLEGNVYFATATEAMARQAQFRNTIPALVIGIGYPSDDTAVSTVRRWLDLTPTPSTDPNEKRPTGGADDFLRMIDEEVKPLVASRYKIDVSRQALWGHSIGGLTVLRALLRRPESFSTYLISTPSIWWDEQVVLRDEAPFGKGMSAAGAGLRILVTSAGEEQYRGEDAKRLAEATRYGMIDKASELAARLGKINPDRLSVQRYLLEGETHISVSHAALTRSLRFAFPYAQP
jgi:predicted alpha/beta superfamily hydrolase